MSWSYFWGIGQNVQTFVRNLIMNFYLDETVTSFNLSFLCCDGGVVKNILSRVAIEGSENITPVVIANRIINGVNTTTYHRFESGNINYEKCRNHFVVLAKMIMMLTRHGIVDYPNGYLITPEKHDRITDGTMHPSELFNTTRLSNSFYVEDLEEFKLIPRLPNSSDTDRPNIYHALDPTILNKILTYSEKEGAHAVLTDYLASKVNMSKKAMVRYLKLFTLFDMLDKEKPLALLTGSEENNSFWP